MRGRIFSEQKCPLCRSSFKHDDHRRGLPCPDHPDQQATKRFIVQFGRNLQKRYSTYIQAERFLDGLRYEVDKGTFDPREYHTSKPLGFTTLSDKWLSYKEKEVKHTSYVPLKGYIGKAQQCWGNRSVKTIQYSDLEDFLFSLDLSDKSKSNVRACLHNFWSWLLRRKEITRAEFPDFPTINFELGWRNTVDKDLQQKIIDEVWNISHEISPRIWIAVKWLSTYISVRPKEMITLLEENIDRRSGLLIIPHPKEKRPKLVPLIEEDIDLLKQFPAGFPKLPFFRHGKGIKSCQPGQRFGKNYVYRWWKRACENLGVEGVDLYGGTRHSSVIALTEFATPEQIKRATMHSTNVAFERYYQVSKNDIKTIYEATRNKPTANNKAKNE